MAGEHQAWIGAPEVVRLFPTFVWKCQLRPEVYRPINESVLKRLEEMRRELPSLDRGAAWQLEPFRGLVSRIGEAVERRSPSSARRSPS